MLISSETSINNSFTGWVDNQNTWIEYIYVTWRIILEKGIVEGSTSFLIDTNYYFYHSMEEFETKNSWDNIEYSWWAKRENKSGKVRYDLIPLPELKRLAELYTRWAEIYWARNWEKWDLEYAENCKQSAFRHFFQYMNGESDEDHFSAILWNLFTIEALKRINKNKCQEEIK